MKYDAGLDREGNEILRKSDKKCKSMACLWVSSVILTLVFVFSGL